MNVQDEIKALKERISQLEKLAREFPQVGDYYWYIEDEGKINACVWNGTIYGENRSSIGNIFRTKEQAEFATEKLKVEAELRRFSRPFENGKYNHYIFFYIDGNTIEVGYKTGCHSQGIIYFESEEKAQQAVSTVGEDRIKKYIFGVED